MTTAQVYTLREFVRDAREIVDRGRDEKGTLALLHEPLSRIIARSDCLADFEGKAPARDPGHGGRQLAVRRLPRSIRFGSFACHCRVPMFPALAQRHSTESINVA